MGGDPTNLKLQRWLFEPCSQKSFLGGGWRRTQVSLPERLLPRGFKVQGKRPRGRTPNVGPENYCSVRFSGLADLRLCVEQRRNVARGAAQWMRAKREEP